MVPKEAERHVPHTDQALTGHRSYFFGSDVNLNKTKIHCAINKLVNEGFALRKGSRHDLSTS